jgi:hypothetical protein
MNFKPILTFIFIYLLFGLSAQKGNFSISVDKDTMYQDEVVKLEIVLENIQGTYTHPDLGVFRIAGGPNTSSSFSMINGEVNQKKSYTYLLLPEATGRLTIGAASLKTNDGVIQTEPVDIFVMEGSGRSKNSSSHKRIYESDQIKDRDTTHKANNKKRVFKKI